MDSFLSILSRILKTLEEHQIDYMIVGSVASIVYGEPRLTKDMDLVVELAPRHVPKFHSIFPEDHYYVPPIEVLADEVSRRGQFNLIDHKSGIKVDCVIRRDTEQSILEFSRKKKIQIFPDMEAFVASPEDVILHKLIYFREGGSQKHLTDIRGILANTEVDSTYLDQWVSRLNCEREWKEASS